MSTHRRISWFRITDTQWQTRDKRGYVGTIDFSDITDLYTLTVAGAAPPAAADYATLKNAKNAFRKFIRTIPPNV